jgi:hypothetical protein
MIKPRFLDKAYLGEKSKAPQTLNATPLFSKFLKFTYATATSPRAIALPLINFTR